MNPPPSTAMVQHNIEFLYLFFQSDKMVNVPRGGAAWLARVAHNHKVAGSNPAPATKKDFSDSGESFLVGAYL